MSTLFMSYSQKTVGISAITTSVNEQDSHDIGLSEREMREIHLVPFRDVIKKYNCQ